MNWRLRSVLIILAVVVLDWLTKVYIRAHVSMFDMFPVIPGFFNIDHAENPGAAFSMLAGAPPQIRFIALLGFSTIVMVIIGVMLWRASSSESHFMRVGLALVFGGALGNLLDRAFRGTVTDFAQFFFGSYEFPSFNVADSAISIGAVFLLYELWRSRKTKSYNPG
jgi:signal peptidase II